jgi:hypothetical protein
VTTPDYSRRVDTRPRKEDACEALTESQSRSPCIASGTPPRSPGTQLQALSSANGVTAFNRPEGGTWDPTRPNDFYFVTTASFVGRSRPWRLRFAEWSQPALGGVIELLLDGTEGQRTMDNLTVDRPGRLLIQGTAATSLTPQRSGSTTPRQVRSSPNTIRSGLRRAQRTC